MSAVMEVREASAKFLSALEQPLVQHFELLATAPGGVARLRELVFTLAVQGKLVPQDTSDAPASELLKKIQTEKDRLIVEGKIKRDTPPTEIMDEAMSLGLPLGWEWSNLSTIGVINPRNDASDETTASFVQMSSIPVAFSEPHMEEPRPWRDIKSGFTQFAEGDVGVAKITPCFENGKSTVFQNLSNGIGAGTTELHIVRPLGGVEPQYVLLFLKTPAFLLRGEAVMTGSAGQKRMPRAYFENTPFPLPPLAEQSRIVNRVEELMRLCDALETKGQLEAAQHAQLVQTLLGALTASAIPDELADNWHRVATHFDLLLDRPEAIDALEQIVLNLAVRGLLVPQDPKDEPASELLHKIRAEKDCLIADCKIKRDKPLEPIDEGEKPFSLRPGWAWIQAQEACEPISLITYGILKPVWVESGVLTVRVQDMKGGDIRLSALGQCSPERAEKFDKTKLVSGDLLIAKDGATLGKTAFVPPALEGANITQHVLRFPINTKLNRQYIRLVVDSEHGQAWMKSETKGVALPGVNVGDFRRMPIPLPPINEQARIIERVTSLRRLCEDLRQRLAARQTTRGYLAEALIGQEA
jgi:type I restriction enzyme S subunit